MLQHADTIRVIAWTNYDGGHGTSSASLLEVAMAGELERSAKMIFFSHPPPVSNIFGV